MGSGALRPATSGVVFYAWEPDVIKRWPPCTECAEQPGPDVSALAINVKRLPPNKRAQVAKELLVQFETLNDGSIQNRKVAKDRVVAAMAQKGFISIPWRMLEDACVTAKFKGKMGPRKPAK
jgi:hypothetical protein